MNKTTSVFATCLLSAAMLAATSAFADDDAGPMYKVTITNLTPGQPLAPVMVATHRPGIHFFAVGEAPSDELARLAEAGDGAPMAAKLLTVPGVNDAQLTTTGLTFPGKSTSLIIGAKRGVDHISIGAMLGATNDAFFAIDDARLPLGHHKLVYMANAYDAGSETNDELQATVAGLGGEGYSPNDSGEGFTIIHNGVHGIGDLNPSVFDWRNPVAEIVIERMQ